MSGKPSVIEARGHACKNDTQVLELRFQMETDRLKRYTEIPQTLQALRPSESHAVLINYNVNPENVPSPFPKTYFDKWDNDHVHLPCSPQSFCRVKNVQTGKEELQSRWSIIQSALSNPITSTTDLAEAILKYNPEYSKQWKFDGLHKVITEHLEPSETKHFFDNVLPKMIELCLNVPNLCTHPIPLLQTGKTYQITFSQKQIASLLANAFFCTFPGRNTSKKSSENNSYPAINFHTLHDACGRTTKIEKLKCLINYFRRVTKEEPTGVVTFHRQCVEEFPKWKESKKTLTNLCVQSKGFIEVDGLGMLQVDFADEFIGGLILKSGCVQEEILFLLCPELIVSRLFTERLNKNEALIVTGCEQFNQYTGYEGTFRWNGNFEDCIPRDSWGRRLRKIAAIDALRFPRFPHSMKQYSPELLQRELEKAYAGFSESTLNKDMLPAVATGNWGCGAFHGDPRLKALLQVVSASQAGRDVLYLTFNDIQLEKDLREVHSVLKSKDMKVGQLVRILEDYNEQVVKSEGESKEIESLYCYIFRRCHVSDSELEK